MRREIVGGSVTPGRTSVSKVSRDLERLDADRADLADPVAAADSPVVSRSKTTNAASSMRVSACAPSASPTLPPSQASRASPSTTSASSECASAAGARSSAKRTRAASSGAHRAPPRVDELDESVGGVEGELHGSPR